MIAACGLGGMAVCPSILALGIRVPDQDAFATARGNAFAATADDPAAVYYNPAGITQLEGMNLSIGAYGIEYGSHFDGPTATKNSRTELAALPQTFTTISCSNCHLAFGLGVYAPYGFSMDWPYSAPWVLAGQPNSSEIDYLRLNPVIAYQPFDSVSIAAGPMFDYADAELKINNFGFGAPGVPFGNHARFRGRATDAGFNAGILWRPFEQHSFGITYRSATDMNFEGHAQSPLFHTAAVGANYHFPQTLTFGYSFRPTSNWNFEADADWSDWSSLRTLQLVSSSPVYNSVSLPFNWSPSWMFEFGATRYLGDGWQLSAGYMYSLNTVPTADFNPLVPDSDRHIFSVGVGKKYKRLSWNVAYQFAWGPPRNVSSTTPGVSGSYEFFSNALSVNFGYHF
jgi:long-chain fatty acid transport protein